MAQSRRALAPSFRDSQHWSSARSWSSLPGTLRRREKRESLLSHAGGTLPLAGIWSAAAPGAAEEEEGAAALALDPAEHEWMLTTAEGNYEALEERLRADPSLLSRRDFITGYSALHWIAKHGRHEDLIRLMSCGHTLDVNAPGPRGPHRAAPRRHAGSRPVAEAADRGLRGRRAPAGSQREGGVAVPALRRAPRPPRAGRSPGKGGAGSAGAEPHPGGLQQ